MHYFREAHPWPYLLALTIPCEMKHSSSPDVLVPMGTGSTPWYRSHWTMGREDERKTAGHCFIYVHQCESNGKCVCFFPKAEREDVFMKQTVNESSNTLIVHPGSPLSYCRLWRLSYQCNSYGVSWLSRTRSKTLNTLENTTSALSPKWRKPLGEEKTMKRDKFQQQSTNGRWEKTSVKRRALWVTLRCCAVSFKLKYEMNATS